MPFKSEAQRRFLWAKKPDLARKWTKKYGSGIGKSIKYKKPTVKKGRRG